MSQDNPDAVDIASRRGFLKALGVGAVQAAAPASLGNTAEVRTVSPVVVLPESRVAGAEHRLSVEARLALQKGSRLAFRREPDNRWDKRAVSIRLVDEEGMEGEIIGYVPRHENTMVCDLLDAGHDIVGELLETERFVLHNKVAPGAEPASDMRFIEEVKPTEDGGRIVKLDASAHSSGHGSPRARLPRPDCRSGSRFRAIPIGCGSFASTNRCISAMRHISRSA